MKKIVFSLFFSAILCGCAQDQQISKVCFNDDCFNVEIADSRLEKVKGLKFREKLDMDKGMLFIFNNVDYHNFWMKNTKIPLDIIWIDENFEVVSIFPNAQPCKTKECESIRPLKKAKYVLEINGGLAAKKGIEVHDFVQFK